MPRIPIDFTLGAYNGPFYNAPSGQRVPINLYPQTVQGGSDTTILKSPSGYTEFGLEFGTGAFKGGIKVGEYYYCVVGTDFLEVRPFVSYTVKGVVPSTGRYIFATNGEYIVLINPAAGSQKDYAFDISTGTLATIESIDANYAAFGNVLDVVYKDDYFVFCAESTVFHGDTVYDAGRGLAFDPTSFDNIPTEAGTVSGLAVANSQLYVMCYFKTLIYQNVGTVPFAFQRNVNLDIEVGLIYSTCKIVVGEEIYFYGSHGSQNGSIYKISGSSFAQLSTGQEKKAGLGNAFSSNNGIFFTHGDGAHQFIFMTGSEDSFDRATMVYDITESKIKGFPVFHYRGYVTASNLSTIDSFYPVKFASIDTASSSGSAVETNFIIQKYDSSGNRTACQIAIINNDRTMDMSQSISGSSYAFNYDFPFIRNGGDSVKVKSVRVRFNQNVNKVELLSSETSKSNDFISHGVIDLTSQGDVRSCEWRRLNRFSSQIMFKLRITEIDSFSSQVSVIDGHVEV